MTKILIVEDSVAQAESLGLVFGAMGHRPLLAGSGDQAVAQVETHGAEAVVLDLRMPGMGGEAFLAWLRGRPDTGRVPVVISTGLPPDRVATSARAARVRVLRKPFTVDELLAAFAEMGLDLKAKGD